MSESKIPARSEIPVEFTWNLSDLYESDDAWMAEYEALADLPAQYASYAGKLGESAQTLLSFLRMDDDADERLNRFYCYASCKSDEDTANNLYQDFKGKAINRDVTISSAASFATPEIMAIPEETLEAFYKEKPELEVYRRSLYRLRRRAAHILTPAEEKLLASAGSISDAASDIGSIFRNADLRFPDVTDKEGVSHPLTSGTLVPLLENGDAEFRKKVFETYYSTLDQYKNTFAATLNHQFKQLRFFAEARNYDNTLTASLDRTEVPVDVYTNLIESVHANLDKMYRYVALRRKMLQLPEVHMYDVYVPMVSDAAKEIPFEEAKKTVLEALSVLGDDYTDILEEGFKNRWIDVYENTGKRSGAYSTGSARPHPYVLMNYKSNLDSMFTVAHEMGHSLHSYYSVKNQPACNSHYVIFVAEVASTCNEILLMRYLLDKTEDKAQKAYLINHFLDEFKGTVYRQTMFAEFELAMGRMCEQEQSLTADQLCKTYYDLNKLYFGPDMISDDGIRLEWARIPHFFMNYYVFQYATGFSAAVAIADRILREGAPAVADYKKFLSSGSSTDPISLLKIAGVDMSTPEPIHAALSLFGELVEEMENLL